MIKDLVVIVDGLTKKAGPYALTLASMFDAHLCVLSAGINYPLESLGYSEVRRDLSASAHQDVEQAARERADKLKQLGKLEEIDVNTLSLSVMGGPPLEMLKLVTRHFDMIVIGQAEPHQREGNAETVEAVLLGSGRPVLVVPYIHAETARFNTILVAWGASAPAARALADALPFLGRANKIELVTVGNRSVRGYDEQGAAVSRHLARRGINATFRRMPNVGDVANTLLSYVADVGSDLLVMGAYGHSRFRETVFGSVTRTILISMTVPVLLSH
jgi:nucleotide-binding universal stress UspA family protein